MPRTLPAALTTAMDAGAYEPYIRVVTNGDPIAAGAITQEPLGYTLRALEAEIEIPLTLGAGYFRIVRGALINGSPVTISSIWFEVVDQVYNGKTMKLRGEALAANDERYQVIAANSTYQAVIEAALTDGIRTIVPSYEGTAAWKAYKFYPAGKQIVLSPRKKLFTLLRQKYLIFAAEDGNDGTDDNIFFFVATQTRATDYSVTDPIYNYNNHAETRQLIWRDEAATVHQIGSATDIIYNLGYLESTAADPVDAATPTNINVGSRSSKLPVHLKYRTGDQVDFAAIGSLNPTATRVNVIEVLDTNSTPSWYMILEALVYFSATEGGPLPSTIEAAAPYTPLATGNFDGILTANDNNLQAAMETIDDHSHTGISTAETNANDIFNVTSPGGGSAFVGTIATLPGGATLTYNITSGQEGAMVPTSTSQLAKMRLYNTTRGTSALISNCVTGTNTLTLTANVPAGWQVGDTITITSQTVSGGGYSWVDLEITSGPTGKSSIFVNIQTQSGTVSDGMRIHPFEASFSASKFIAANALVAAQTTNGFGLQKIVSNVFSLAWTGTPTAIVIREAGYLS